MRSWYTGIIKDTEYHTGMEITTQELLCMQVYYEAETHSRAHHVTPDELET